MAVQCVPLSKSSYFGHVLKGAAAYDMLTALRDDVIALG